MNASVEVYNSRAEWLAARRTGIGSSDAAAILGESSWASPYSIWAEKRGLEFDDNANERIEWGNKIEPLIRQAYTEKTGRPVEHFGSYAIVRNNKYPWLISSLDGKIAEPNAAGILECKNVDRFIYNKDEWRTEPPIKYQIQIQHAMAATEFKWGSLAYLVGGNEFHYLDVEAAEKFQSLLIERLEEFWECVQTGKQPEIDGSSATTRAIKALHPLDNGESVELPREAIDRWNDRVDLAERIKRLEDEKSAHDNWFKSHIGDATYGVAEGRTWSLKSTTRAAYQAKESTFRTLRKVGK